MVALFVAVAILFVVLFAAQVLGRKKNRFSRSRYARRAAILDRVGRIGLSPKSLYRPVLYHSINIPNLQMRAVRLERLRRKELKREATLALLRASSLRKREAEAAMAAKALLVSEKKAAQKAAKEANLHWLSDHPAVPAPGRNQAGSVFSTQLKNQMEKKLRLERAQATLLAAKAKKEAKVASALQMVEEYRKVSRKAYFHSVVRGLRRGTITIGELEGCFRGKSVVKAAIMAADKKEIREIKSRSLLVRKFMEASSLQMSESQNSVIGCQMMASLTAGVM